MKAICHLDLIGRALPTTFGVRAGSIADYDLDAWVMTQPVGEYVGSAIVEHIDRSVCLEVDQQCSVPALLPAQGRIVNTQNPGPRWSSASVSACMSRRSVSGLTGTPALRARRAPPSPPACSANV